MNILDNDTKRFKAEHLKLHVDCVQESENIRKPSPSTFSNIRSSSRITYSYGTNGATFFPSIISKKDFFVAIV